MIVINLITARIGGGKVIKDNLMRDLEKYLNNDFRVFILIASDDKGYYQFNNEKIKIVKWPTLLTRGLFLFLSFTIFMPLFLMYIRANKVINFSDVPIFTHINQIYHFDWPYAILNQTEDNIGDIGIIRKLKCKIHDFGLRYVNLTIVQTDFVGKRFIKKYGNKPIIKIPSFFGPPFQLSHSLVLSSKPQIRCTKDKYFKIIYPADFYPHKNFSLILNLARLIKKQDLPITIYLTLRLNHTNKLQRLFFNMIESEKLGGIIMNSGYIDHNLIPSIFNQFDAVFFPSRVETLGLPYVEAMYLKMPIFAADIEVAHEMCSDAAYYFNPNSANSALLIICEFLKSSNEQIYSNIENGFQLSMNHIKNNAVEEYMRLLNN